jgi:AsmA-like C-terminal region
MRVGLSRLLRSRNSGALRLIGTRISPAAGRFGSASVRAAGAWAMFAAKVVLPIVLLAAMGVGIFYVRLLNGPISINFLAGPITTSINSELDGFRVEVPEAVFRLVDRRLEFQLKNIKLYDASGNAVAVAPLASVEVSRRAFYSGRISPSRIVLIEPRLLLYYDAQGGLSLSYPKGPDHSGQSSASHVPAIGDASGQGVPPDAAAAPVREGGVPPQKAAGRLDVTQTIAALARRARNQQHATSYFESIGLRNATVIFDHSGTQTVWRVPNASFDLKHFDRRSVVSGLVSVAASSGLMRIALRAEESEQSRTVNLSATARDINLQGVASAMPDLDGLKAAKFPVSVSARLTLASDGDVIKGDVELEAGRGIVDLPWFGRTPPKLDSARLVMTYRRGQNDLIIQPSTLRWSGSEVTIGGRLSPAFDPEAPWTFELTSLRGALSPQSAWGTAQALKEWSAQGRLDFNEAVVHLDQVIMKTPSGSGVMAGRFFLGERPGYDLSGAFSEMPARALLTYWPEFLANSSRKFYAERVRGGTVKGGRFQVKLRSAPQGSGAAKPAFDWSTNLNLEFADLSFVGNEKLPQIYTPKAQFVLADDRLQFAFDAGAFTDGGKTTLLVLNGFEFDAGKVYAPSVDGQLKVRVSGQLAGAIPILDQRPFGWKPVPQDLRSKISGKIDANIDGTIPLVRPDGEAVPASQLTGQLRLLEGAGKGLLSGQDVTGATILVDIGSKLVNGRGKFLIAGVPATVSWQRIVGIPEDEQPPVRLKTKLAAAERAALGLAVNHIVHGEIGVEALWKPKDGGLGELHVRADLSRADIAVESLAWRKPIGQEGALEFDVLSKGKQPIGLSNIRLTGRGVAIEGYASLGPKGEIASFDFPLFSVNTVTRLKLLGVRQAKNVWRVSVRGRTYEGRDLFRALFSAGRLREKKEAAAPTAPEPGLQLDVKVATVLGFWNSTLRDVSVELTKQDGKIENMIAHGTLKSGKKLIVHVKKLPDGPRRLVAVTDDAGAAFELVGFYANARGGRMRLIVSLDGDGRAEKTGKLEVVNFSILGDPVVSEVVGSQNKGAEPSRRRALGSQPERQLISFDWMRVPFSVGHGQFVLKEAELRGPLAGAVLRGKADFNSRSMNLGGTYVPLQGLNSVLGALPGIGQILAGQRGEGVWGVNFAVRGGMSNPEVLVHPLSLLAPGILRELFSLTTPKPEVAVPGEAPRNGNGTGSEWRKRLLEGGQNN